MLLVSRGTALVVVVVVVLIIPVVGTKLLQVG